MNEEKQASASKDRRSVCLFGLSADPVTGHEGHVGIVQALQRQQEWDEIWVLPVYRHTFTEKRERLVPFEHRMNMCAAAFADMKGVKVSDAERLSWEHAVKDIADEAERDQVVVGTASLLVYLKEKHVDTDFQFCLGADSFLDLMDNKWKETAGVLEQLQGGRGLVVLHRSGWDNDTDTNATTTRKSEQLSAQIEKSGARLLQIGQLGSISSTQVRECKDLQLLSSMLVPAVLDYIKANCLYQFAKDNNNNAR